MKPVIRQTEPRDFPKMIELCRRVYPGSPPWEAAQLASHVKVFPEGQLVAESPDGAIVGLAASLIINWDDYNFQDSWRDVTDAGYFTNHDPKNGRTLYGAEIMVDPAEQGKGTGKLLYAARRQICQNLSLLRIRAGARLRGYSVYADHLTPAEYVKQVVGGNLSDPTLSFQLKHGFQVLAITSGYLKYDPESLGYAAVIEWMNTKLIRPEDRKRQQSSEFYRSLKSSPRLKDQT